MRELIKFLWRYIMYDTKHFLTTEGIDTISFEVNSFFISKEKWRNGTRVRPGITLRIKYSYLYCINTTYPVYICDVQFEALDMSKSILPQIINILYYDLYKDGYCDFTFPTENEIIQRLMLLQCIHSIITLKEIDFFFDFSEKSAVMLGNMFPTGTYSKDHKRKKSLWIFYDRRKKLIQQNQIKHSEIMSMPYPYRLEIRLNTDNNNYLSLTNLVGSYYEIMTRRFRNFISKSWRKYNLQMASVIADFEHPMFSLICEYANKNIPIPNNKEIEKTPKKSMIVDDPLLDTLKNNKPKDSSSM